LSKVISKTAFHLHPDQEFYSGKVRDVYFIKDYIVVVATDRISAFDHILPDPIPCKGQVLNQLAAWHLEMTKDIAPNWYLSSPHPQVSIGHRCKSFKLEMVVRAYLTGHAWRTYQSGKRILCGVSLPDGLREHQQLPHPIITPTTKADEGHDEDISREEILSQVIVDEATYTKLENKVLALFKRGSELANGRGLILVDTKYELGLSNQNEILVIDEIHTPDSSRYFYKEDYQLKFFNNEAPAQLSKEFVREWLMAHGFNGSEDQIIPRMPQTFIDEVSKRYIKLYEMSTAKQFVPAFNTTEEIEVLIKTELAKLL